MSVVKAKVSASKPGSVRSRTGFTSSTCSIATRDAQRRQPLQRRPRRRHRPEQHLRLGPRRDHVRRDAAGDQADGIEGPAELGILGQLQLAAARGARPELVDRVLAARGLRGVGGAAARDEPQAQHAARGAAEAAAGGLAVQQEAGARRELVRGERAVAAALLAHHEQQAELAARRRCRSRSAAITCAASAPLASQAPRPKSVPPSTRLAKNGGTQSMWVDSTTSGRRTSSASTLKRPSDDRLLDHLVAARAQLGAQERHTPSCSRPVVESMSMSARARSRSSKAASCT